MKEQERRVTMAKIPYTVIMEDTVVTTTIYDVMVEPQPDGFPTDVNSAISQTTYVEPKGVYVERDVKFKAIKIG